MAISNPKGHHSTQATAQIFEGVIKNRLGKQIIDCFCYFGQQKHAKEAKERRPLLDCWMSLYFRTYIFSVFIPTSAKQRSGRTHVNVFPDNKH